VVQLNMFKIEYLFYYQVLNINNEILTYFTIKIKTIFE